MEKTMSSLLVALGVKSLLNWMVVLWQKRYMGQSFVGAFCVSLALVDTLLAVTVSVVYSVEDFRLLGLWTTRYHICLLVQLACFTYSLLHWPVFLLTMVDHYWTTRLSPQQPPRFARKLGYAFVACTVWIMVLLYVFWISDFYPDLEEEVNLLLRQCRVPSSPQCSHVSIAVLLVLGSALLCCSQDVWAARWGRSESVHTPASRKSGPFCWDTLYLTVVRFFSTWVPFVVLKVALLLFSAEVPAYLDMNVLWLCFLNSFLIGAFSWTGNNLAFADGFCDWHLGFVSAEANSESAVDLRASRPLL